MENNKKEKVINLGVSEELMAFMDKWMEDSNERIDKQNERKEPGLEVKRVIVEMAKNELTKIQKGFEKEDLKDSEWYDLMNKVDKISELVRWY